MKTLQRFKLILLIILAFSFAFNLSGCAKFDEFLEKISKDDNNQDNNNDDGDQDGGSEGDSGDNQETPTPGGDSGSSGGSSSNPGENPGSGGSSSSNPGGQVSQKINVRLYIDIVDSDNNLDTEIIIVQAVKTENILNKVDGKEESYKETGDTFSGWYFDGEYTDKVANDAIFPAKDNISLYGKITRKNYVINKGSVTNGTFEVKNKSSKGLEVSVSATPNDGYTVKEMYYIEMGSSEKKYFTNSFIMPNKIVTVYVIFSNDINIYTKDDLINYLQNKDNWNRNYVLHNDIDLKGMEWNPIGDIYKSFTGIFDGNNHEIYNFNITSTENPYIGFFGYIEGGQIKNLGLNQIDIEDSGKGKGWSFVGGLVGVLENATISNCYVKGEITTEKSRGSSIGGLVGKVNEVVEDMGEALIENSYTEVTINTISNGISVGGLIGLLADAVVKNCYSLNNINVQYANRGLVGGLVGRTYESSLEKNYSSSNVYISANSDVYAGGLVGRSEYTTIKNNYSTGNVDALSNEGVCVGGGIAGYFVDGNIENNYSTGNVSVVKNNVNSYLCGVGGIIGASTLNDYITIKYNYSTGDLTLKYQGESTIGGILGESYFAYADSTNYRYSGQQIVIEDQNENNEINNDGKKADMATIWQYINENWDSSIWNLSLNSNPTLK